MGRNEGAEKHGRHYETGEIALIFLTQKSQEAMRKLAELLGRTPDAIDWVWGWCEERAFPPKASNLIRRQVAEAKKTFGENAKGSVVII